MSTVVVGVGTNLGAREAAIHAARALLDSRNDIDVVDVSPIYETAPIGPPQGAFLNAAFRIETSRPPEDLLNELLRIERRLGRVRRDDARWGPRSIDLDLLWDERGEHRSAALTVPHPELLRRAFALAPLLDVVPEAGAVYERALQQAGGRPATFARAALVALGPDAVVVEADSLADACALCLPNRRHGPRPWSTHHVVVRSSEDHLLEALRERWRTGFDVTAITISHCSESQWVAQFHGGNVGAPVAHDVRFETTSGTRREFRRCLSFDPPGSSHHIF